MVPAEQQELRPVGTTECIGGGVDREAVTGGMIPSPPHIRGGGGILVWHFHGVPTKA